MAAGHTFSLAPVEVPPVETRFRRIATPIPAPGTEAVFGEMARSEAQSMHGQMPIVWDRASGFQVWDHLGNCWIDFTSTIFVTSVGHAHPRIKAALLDVVSRDLLHSYTYATEVRTRYLRRLAAFVPPPLEKAFLVSAGTEATEVALKLMRLHGQATGKRKPGVISFNGAMHGRTMGAVLMGGNPASRAWVGFDDPHIYRLDFPAPWSLNGMSGAELARRDLDSLAARGIDLGRDVCGLMLESYQGWGAIFYPPDYVQVLAEFAHANGALLTFDEIQAGFGRTGTLFAYQHYGVTPDLICCGKGMGSGVPLAGVIGRAQVLDLAEVGSMSSTHSANPLVCAAGLATLDVIEEEGLVAQSARRGHILHTALDALRQRWPQRISYVLGKGMLAAVLLRDPASGAPDGATASRICELCLQRGLLLVHTGRESIKIGPPLIIDDDALREGLAVLESAMEDVFGKGS